MFDTPANSFIVSTDFPTLKNRWTASGTVNIPGSSVIPGNGFAYAEADVEVGNIGAVNRGRIASSKNFTQFYLGENIRYGRTGTAGGMSAPYDIFCYIFRSSPSTLRFQVYIPNPNSINLTMEAGDETIYFYCSVISAPYI